jgi:hypothetical protein
MWLSWLVEYGYGEEQSPSRGRGFVLMVGGDRV